MHRGIEREFGTELRVSGGTDNRVTLSGSASAGESKFLEILSRCLQHIVEQVPLLHAKAVSDIQLVPPDIGIQHLGLRKPVEPAASLVHEAIEEQSRRTPDRVAGVEGKREITYRELNERSNQLANYLGQFGVGRDVIVAVHLQRSIDLLIAILGILKSGAAFLPLDASLPAGRIETVMRDSRAPVVITSNRLALRFWESSARVICLDSENQAWRKESSEDCERRAQGQDLAYVTYTSGSMGTPKGVMIEHRNLTASFAGMDGVIGITPGVWLAMANISFDIALTELLWPLCRGFQIVVHEGDAGTPIISGSSSVPAQMIRHGVTHLQGTPSLVRMLLTHSSAGKAFSGLRKLLVGGEPFPPALVETLKELVPGEVFNMYGPTEATICATFHRVDAATPNVPIGKPTVNTSVYVLDKAGRLVPPFASGELCLGGFSIARGYIGKPALTADRFSRDRFASESGQRVYKTGDLVQFDLEGNLHFIQRADDQVKLRGFRIELGEIENALQTHAGVSQAVAVLREEASGEKILAGYFTTAPGRKVVSAAELRRFVEKTLPSYMVPGMLVHLENLPLTSNGKVDRAKLAERNATAALSSVKPARDLDSRPAAPRPREAALAPIEQALCHWLGELLALPAVKLDDDFFEIGGQSLVAAQLVQKIATRYRVHVNLSVFLKTRTMRVLAEWVLNTIEGAKPAWTPLVDLRQQGSEWPVFLIAGAGGSVVNFELLSRRLGSDRPLYAIETQGLGTNCEVLPTVEDMARSYLEEVRRVQPSGPYHLVGYSFGGIIAFEMAQQLRARGQELGLLGLIDTPELNYSRRVKASLGLARRMSLEYGGTLRRAIFGPDRLDALTRRAGAAAAACRSALERFKGNAPPPVVVNAERRNLEALAHYVPKFYAGDIHLFRCPDPSPLRGADVLLGWGPFAQRVEVSEVPGEHGSLITAPYVGDLGAALSKSLASVDTQLPKPRAEQTNRLREFGHPIGA